MKNTAMFDSLLSKIYKDEVNILKFINFQLKTKFPHSNTQIAIIKQNTETNLKLIHELHELIAK